MEWLLPEYAVLKEFIDHLPVIETHEHHGGFTVAGGDPLEFILNVYYKSDFVSAGFGLTPTEERKVFDKDAPLEERLVLFKRIYILSSHTAYARGVQVALKKVMGIDLDKLDMVMLKLLEEKLAAAKPDDDEKLMEGEGIKAAISDLFNIAPYVTGQNKNLSKKIRLAIPTPDMHNLHAALEVENQLNMMDAQWVTSLEDYINALDDYFGRCVKYGCVCIKDQSAYLRDLSYEYPSSSEAQKLFNRIMSDPRDVLGEKEGRPLDDYLFHQILRLAQKYNLPVQLHTGHMAHIRNEIMKTNAIHLTPVLELYRNVWFDLFHGNWPFMDEYLFLGKNYPNVSLDLCWVQFIDPDYCVELMKRAVKIVPHNKLMAFGGDSFNALLSVGYLEITRQNVARALASLVNEKWLSLDDARQVAADWFFNNPNTIFRLGFEPVSG